MLLLFRTEVVYHLPFRIVRIQISRHIVDIE